MRLPTFRFIDAGKIPFAGDAEFWRDVEASDRLASPIKADIYLRELCRTKAAGEVRSANDRSECEQALLLEVQARGYRLVDGDFASFTTRHEDKAVLQSA